MCLRKWQHRELTRGMNQWKHAAAAIKLEKQIDAKKRNRNLATFRVLKHWLNRHLGLAMNKWLGDHRWHKEMMIKVDRILRRFLKAALWKAFNTWSVNAREMNWMQRVLKQAVLRMLRLQMFRAFAKFRMVARWFRIEAEEIERRP